MSDSAYVGVCGKGGWNIVDLFDGGEHDEHGVHHFLQGVIFRSV